MRAALIGLGATAALGVGIAMAVHEHVSHAADISSYQSQDYSSINRPGPMLLAGDPNNYGAARKMMGSTYYASGTPTANEAARPGDSSAPPFNPTAGDTSSDGTSDGTTSGSSASGSNPQSNQKQVNSNQQSGSSKPGTNRPGGFQAIFPSATLNSGNRSANSANQPANSSANSSATKTRGDSGESTDSTTNSGLKSLQQRLNSVRKSSGTPTTAPEMRSSAVESPTMTSSIPSPGGFTSAPSAGSTPFATGTGVQQPSVISAQEGPSPPNMPSIRTAGLPNTAPGARDSSGSFRDATPAFTNTIGQRDSASTNIDATPVRATESNGNTLTATTATAAPLLGGPVVGGPVSTSRRALTTPTVTMPSGTVSQTDEAHTPVNSQVTTGQSGSDSRPINSVRKTTSTADSLLFARQSPLMGVETSGPRSITVGKEANYTITITNAGEVAAQDVLVSVKIPQWTEIVGTKATSGTAELLSEQHSEPLMWRLPRLEARSKEQLTVRLIPRESKPFDLAVQWACSPVASQAMVEVKEPKLAMVLDGPSEVLYGQTKVYKLTISNPGSGDAESVVLMLAPVDGGTGAPTRHEIGMIHAGESKPVEVELTARQAGTLAIKARVSADGNLKADVAQDILVRRAGLKMSVTAPELKFAGTPTTYSVVVANPGNATAENISVAAILPPGAKFISSPGGQFMEQENKVVWSLASLRSGAEQELELRCALNTPGSNRLQLLSTAATDLSDSTAASTNVEALADLKLEVTDPPGPLAVGEEMVYEVHIRNRGTKAAENVDVAGFFSNGVEPISAQGAQNEVGPGQVVFRPIGSIPAGTEVVLKIKAKADLAGNHVFRAEVNCPTVGAKLASEETTMFYGDGRSAARTAARPSSGAGSSGGESTPATLR